MFNNSITLYNKYTENGTEKWKRTIISGVYFDSIKGHNFNKSGNEKANKAQIIIPKRNMKMNDYLRPKEFEGAIDKSNKWTIQDDDTIVRGEISFEIVKSTKELYQHYDNVFVVTSVDFKDFGNDMSHWEVNAK